VNTPYLSATVASGLEMLRVEVEAHKEAGRMVYAAKLEQFCDATAEYIRLLENGIRAARGSIRALESR
jgi:hypothetical protein